MNIKDRPLYYILIAFSVLFIFLLPCQVRSDDIPVYIDGNPIVFNEGQPFMAEGYVMVPFQEFMGVMGYSLTYGSESNTIIAKKSSFIFEATPGTDYLKLNDVPKELITPVQLKDNLLYAPIRPLVEYGGGSILWNAQTRSVLVITQDKEIEQILKSDNNAIFLSENDPQNPVNVWRQPISYRIVETAKYILGGRDNLSDHQKIVAFMDYLSTFEVGMPEDTILEHNILEKKGSCGSFTNILLALAATQNIPGHVVSLANFPQNDGHSVAELYVNGKWEIFDPTFGSYYTDEPDNKVSPNVLSFDDLKNGKGRQESVKCIIGNPQRIERVPANSVYLGPEIYEKAEPAGPIGPNNPFVYPLQMDMRSKTKISGKDLFATNQGALYLGAAGICNTHKWSLEGLEPGEKYCFTLIPDWIGGEFLEQHQVFEAKASLITGGRLISGEKISYPVGSLLSPWKIEFIATNTKTIVMLDHSYRGPEFFYLHLAGYELEKI